jgi:ATP-dependent Clp protease protease subunit
MNVSQLKEDTLLQLLNAETPVIPIYEDIDWACYSRVRDSLTILAARQSPRIKLLIDSAGGGVAAGLSIYDALMSYSGGIDGFVIGRANSMAAILLQACKNRSCARHGSVLIHHVISENVSLDDLTSAARLQRLRRGAQEDQQRLYRILSSRTQKPVSEIRKTCRKDYAMTSEEALAFGLIDEISDGTLT